MKICTYNVNGINGRLPVLLRWLGETAPDVVCLQELKAPQEKFPEKDIQDAGYHAVWHGQKSWNGVAILARTGQPQETRRELPGDQDDGNSRYIEAMVNGILVGCLYLPNGNPAPGPKFDYKLRWFERLTSHAAGLLASGIPVVLAGDYNVMPTEMDVYKPERWQDDALFRPEVRSAFKRLVAQGWTDAIRKLHPNDTVYTSGIIFVMHTDVMQVYVSIISCLVRNSIAALLLPVLTLLFVDGKKQAITPRSGSSWQTINRAIKSYAALPNMIPQIIITNCIWVS